MQEMTQKLLYNEIPRLLIVHRWSTAFERSKNYAEPHNIQVLINSSLVYIKDIKLHYPSYKSWE